VEKKQNIHSNLVEITSHYLGPAAERFIDRQIQNHLNKQPENITKKDVSLLVDWIRSSVSMLTDNEDLVEEYIEQLQKLAKGKPQPTAESG
jgi:dolichyl-phosphate-mannose--protein O-mannosyl transferase